MTALFLISRLNIMRIPRIYHPESLKNQSTCQLSEDAANHVGRVLRMTEGEQIELFDGSNHIYPAKIIEASKKAVKVEILGCELSDKESNFIDSFRAGYFTWRSNGIYIQKSVELGR